MVSSPASLRLAPGFNPGGIQRKKLSLAFLDADVLLHGDRIEALGHHGSGKDANRAPSRRRSGMRMSRRRLSEDLEARAPLLVVT